MIISQYVIPDMKIRDHAFRVPLDWSNVDDGRSIDVFAREVVDPSRDSEPLPKLLYLEGGPGSMSPRPGSGPVWLKEALKTHRVILLDQRGTGRSGRINIQEAETLGPEATLADRLCLYRADSIVRDAEHLRKTAFEAEKWEILGQSYGGFIAVTYLSIAPEGLAACYVTGGLPGLEASAKDVYRRTFPRANTKMCKFYRRFPDDQINVARVADIIDGSDVRLPDGDRLTIRRLQVVGMGLRFGSSLENVHWLFDEAFADQAKSSLSEQFLASIQSLTSFDRNPLYMLLQESIYGQGQEPTNWAAQQVLAEHPKFSSDQRPLLFPGEMASPWMFRDIRSLRPFQAAAESLATHDRYSPLYEKARLAANEVPVAAAIYLDDLYVDFDLSIDTSRQIGNAEAWVTNEYEHDGLRVSSAVFGRLRDMVRERGGALAR